EVLGGLNAFYLLRGEPEVYGLPGRPLVPSANVPRSTFWAVLVGIAAALGALFKFRDRTKPPAPLPPSPLVGEGRGGGASDTGQGASTPHPNPPPQGGRGPEGRVTV